MANDIRKVALTKLIENKLYKIYPQTEASVVDYNKTVVVEGQNTTVATTVAAELAALQTAINALPTTADLTALETKIIGTLGDNESLAEAFDTLKEISAFLEGSESIQTLSTLINNVGHAAVAADPGQGIEGQVSTGLHAITDAISERVAALEAVAGTNVSKTKTVDSEVVTAANGHLFLNGVDTTVYDDAALGSSSSAAAENSTAAWGRILDLQSKVGKAADTADRAGTTAWSQINALDDSLGLAADTANRAGTTAWSQINALDDSLGTSEDAAAAAGTTAWSRIKALEEVGATKVSKTSGSNTAANGKVYVDDVLMTVYDDTEVGTSADAADASANVLWKRVKAVEGEVGKSTDTAAAAGTTAWSRIKNAEGDIDALELKVGASGDAAAADGTTLWSRVKNAETDIDNLQAGLGAATDTGNRAGTTAWAQINAIDDSLGTADDTANAAGTTAWSRIKAIEAWEDQVQYVNADPANPASNVLYMVAIA